MSNAIAAMIGVAVALPACSFAGGWLINRTTGTDAKPPFACARCDVPNLVFSPLTRCGPCEARVTDILLNAAARGVRLDDPLTEIRRRMTREGL